MLISEIVLICHITLKDMINDLKCHRQYMNDLNKLFISTQRKSKHLYVMVRLVKLDLSAPNAI